MQHHQWGLSSASLSPWTLRRRSSRKPRRRPRPGELRAFYSCMAWRAIPGPFSKLKRRLDSLEAAQGAPRDPRRDSRGERSPWLPLETRPAHCEGERVIALESWKVYRASRRVEEGLSMSFSGCSGKPSCPSPSAGDLRELPSVPLRGEGSCGGPGVSGDFWGSQEGCQGPSRPSGRNRGLPLPLGGTLWVISVQQS